jgi:hypothetical protein
MMNRRRGARSQRAASKLFSTPTASFGWGRRLQSRAGAFACLVPAAILFLTVHFAQAEQPQRPKNVPSDAILVKYEEGAVWQRCAITPTNGFIRCQIYSEKGRTEHDESFFPYDEGPTLEPAELKIAANDPDAGPDWVCLENGRILMPGSRYDYVKGVLNKKLPKERQR